MAHAIPQPQVARQLLETQPLGPLADHEKARDRPLAGDPCGHPQEQRVVLLGPQRRHDADQRLVGREAGGAARRPAIGGGMEAREVHAVSDHRDAQRIEPMAAQQELLVARRERDESVGDRKRGAGRQRMLDPVIGLAGGVKPHHQAGPGAPAAQPAGPEQRQRAVRDVDHVHLALLEQGGEPAAHARVPAPAREPAHDAVAGGRHLLADRTRGVQVHRQGGESFRIERPHQELRQALRAAHRHGGLQECDTNHAWAGIGPAAGAMEGRPAPAARGAVRASRGRSR